LSTGCEEFSGGVRQQYSSGAILCSYFVNRAHTMNADQHCFWSWGGKSAFGFPTANTRKSTFSSKIDISEGPKGYVTSTMDNVTKDALADDEDP
jgi:hypothetical protein